jgi:acyl carrier protein
MEANSLLLDAVNGASAADTGEPPATAAGTVARSRDELEDWLIKRLASLSGIDPAEIDIEQPFADYSLDSSVAVTVTNEFSAWLARDLSITMFWEYPSIRALAQSLAPA